MNIRKMIIGLLLPALLCLSAVPLSAETAPQLPQAALSTELTPKSEFWDQLFQNSRTGGAAVLSAACCKVCRKGKACGDSCISRSYTCRKGLGCACDG